MHIKKNYIFNNTLNLMFLKNYNILILSDFLGLTFFYLPSFFFFLIQQKK